MSANGASVLCHLHAARAGDVAVEAGRRAPIQKRGGMDRQATGTRGRRS